ncbi:MAG: hypothetical protein HOM14_03655 [Gammaproteobacteria bacterium]|nr:hypothetical protein [Gammaproteobacteria bacterium]MBT4075095.1 hypothetical protein [Gammaproteobacteria bacterium]MBT4196313.1 hypothetical protein [Gammaproteobacteria bacterium]MBT4451275.1 hypothetical protein [Gammaproteobacteria bacterium]MBT4859166.1 hypothetical protein [Gammaproteobacteria bacterium]
MNYESEDPVSELYDQKIELAKDGDVKAAKWLLQNFHDSISETLDKDKMILDGASGAIVNIHPSLAIYLSDCFGLFLENENSWPIDKALNLYEEPTGEELDNRNIEICCDILRQKEKTRFLREAKHIVRKKYPGRRNQSMSFETINKIWKTSEWQENGKAKFEKEKWQSELELSLEKG